MATYSDGVVCYRNSNGKVAFYTETVFGHFETLKDAPQMLVQHVTKHLEGNSASLPKGLTLNHLRLKATDQLQKNMQGNENQNRFWIRRSFFKGLCSNAKVAKKVFPGDYWYLIDNTEKVIVERRYVHPTETVLGHFMTNEDAAKKFSQEIENSFKNHSIVLRQWNGLEKLSAELAENVYQKLLKTMNDKGSKDLIVITGSFYEGFLPAITIKEFFQGDVFYLIDMKAKTIVKCRL